MNVLASSKQDEQMQELLNFLEDMQAEADQKDRTMGELQMQLLSDTLLSA